jgi:putative ATP-dependent endonuclease of the OLD family
VAKEIQQKGAEVLMAEETPLDRQWQYLELLRAEDSDGRFMIPNSRPADMIIRGLTISTLKGLKGEGGAAKLLALCTIDELPNTGCYAARL